MKDMAKSTSDPAADDQKQSAEVRDDLDKKDIQVIPEI